MNNKPRTNDSMDLLVKLSKQTDFKIQDFKMFLWFVDNQNLDGLAFYCPTEIAIDLGITPRTVINRTKKLVNLGLITRLRTNRVKVNHENPNLT